MTAAATRTFDAERLLIVDDDRHQRQALEGILAPHGFDCVHAATADRARAAVMGEKPTLALVDIRVAGDAGPSLVRDLMERRPDLALIVVSTVADPHTASAVVRWGVHGYVVKPFAGEQVLVSVLNAMQLRDVQMQARGVREDLERSLMAQREAADRLRAMDEYKNGLLRAIAHDFRTPLTAILGFATTIRREGASMPPSTADHLLERVEANARRLLGLIADLRQFDRMTEGGGGPQLETVDVAQIASGLVDALDASDHSVQLRTSGSTLAHADRWLTERVIDNLLSNAIRHTPPGTQVWVGVTSADGNVLLTISDAGPGIPDEVKADLFRPVRGKADATGHGLGLGLVGQFIELQRGQVWVADRAGGGATFAVQLPGALPGQPAGG